jgi:hypothetical protein
MAESMEKMVKELGLFMQKSDFGLFLRTTFFDFFELSKGLPVKDCVFVTDLEDQRENIPN